ncbi:MAG: copper homeostasis membrane protein CopD [Novosphingobium sp.]
MIESGLIAARVTTYAALMLAAGIPLYLIAARRQASLERGACRTASMAALAGIAASLWWILENIAAMAAMPVAQLDRAMITAVLEATPLGSVLVIRLIALAIAAVALCLRYRVAGAVAASLALATSSWTGHAGATEAGLGALHRACDVLHLLAAATWLGALVLFVTAAIRGDNKQQLVVHLAGFAKIGSAIVLLLLLTGLANTLIIAGWPPDWRSGWFALLAAKFALFTVMLALAASNRWRLTPALERDPTGGLHALKLSLFAETGAALAIVAIVGWLGTLTPV